MQQNGWTLLFHDNLIEQMMKLRAAVLRAQESDPDGFASNANVKFFRALTRLIQDVVPSDPARDEYCQSNTMGPAWRHWRRAKLGRRYRLFFRYDSKAKVIVYAWVNDQQSLRSSGSKSDPYAVFGKMLDRGNPPDDWKALVEQASRIGAIRVRSGAFDIGAGQTPRTVRITARSITLSC